MSWTEKIAGCFGERDHSFALHPLDIQRAQELFRDHIPAELNREQVLTEFKNYLKSRKCSEQHINTQMLEVNEFIDEYDFF